MCGERMVEVVDVLARVAHHQFGTDVAVDVGQTQQRLVGHAQGIVAEVEALQRATEDLGGALRLFMTGGLHAVHRHARLAPHLGRFAALAERQADDAHVVAALRVERDGAAGAPDEVSRVGADNQNGRPGRGGRGRSGVLGHT
ncbi:hypothetical protein D3C86_1753310 [compost metagenome]